MNESDGPPRSAGSWQAEILIGEASSAAGVLVVPISQLHAFVGAAATRGQGAGAGGGGAALVPRALLVLLKEERAPRLLSLTEGEEPEALWRELLEKLPGLWERARASFAAVGRDGLRPPFGVLDRAEPPSE